MTELLVDATSLGTDSAYRGIGTYLRQLLARLATDDRLSITALARPGTQLPSGVEPVIVRRIAPPRFRVAEHELLLPLDLRRRRAEVFHSPGLDPPRRSPMPWVGTLHDVIPLVLEYPDLASERRRWRRYAPRYRDAEAVVADSRHTADDGIRVLGLDPGRVEVIPLGVDARFCAPPEPRGADPPYLLAVGEYSRRKGYPEAFAVAGALAEAGYPHRLRVVGRIAPWTRPAIDACVTSAARPDRIDVLGFVDDLVAEYQGASLLLFTSRYEGFGLPLLEAMACGTPIVAFANSAITEVVSDAGILVDDGDVREMVRAARSLLDDDRRWQELSERGLERARSFSWERSATAYADLFASVTGR